MAKDNAQLPREVGVFGATMLGLGSIVGTGVFVSIGVAAGVAGPAVILAIAVAGLIAMCNAFSSAQLAANHAVSGGTYEYGYQWLNPALGFTAGWMFLLAKSASAATAALGFAGYALHALRITDTRWLTPLAILVAAAMTLLVLAGIRRSNIANAIIVSVTLASLIAFVVAGLPRAVSMGTTHLIPFVKEGDGIAGSIAAVLHGCALMFVAFTGYGRIATLGEEVRRPQRTIPRAIVLTLIVSAILYIAVGCIAVASYGTEPLAEATRQRAAPLEIVARTFPWTPTPSIVAIGAVTAMLGVLLNLILGLSRVLLAMGRRGDMPRIFARLDQRQTTPGPAVLAVGLTIVALTAIGDVRLTWSFSAFAVLIYYAITNLAAIQLAPQQRLYSPLFAWVGLLACLFLAFWVDWQVWLVGLALLVLGLGWHGFRRRMHPDR